MEKKISAGRLREMGFEIPSTIPDCAETSLGAIRMEAQNFHSPESGMVACDIVLDCGAPFEWAEVKVKKEKE